MNNLSVEPTIEEVISSVLMAVYSHDVLNKGSWVVKRVTTQYRKN